MNYTVTHGNRQMFEVSTETGQPVGSLTYKSVWAPKTATIVTADGDLYLIGPTGFWRSAISVTQNSIPFAELRTDWRGGLILSLQNGPSYRFKRRGILSSGYVIADADEQLLGSVDVRFRLRTFSNEYSLVLNEHRLGRQLSSFLPLIFIYALRYLRMRHSAS